MLFLVPFPLSTACASRSASTWNASVDAAGAATAATAAADSRTTGGGGRGGNGGGGGRGCGGNGRGCSCRRGVVVRVASAAANGEAMRGRQANGTKRGEGG